MSLAIGVVSNSERSMGFDDNVKDNNEEGAAAEDNNDTSRVGEESGGEEGGTLSRYKSESSVAATEDEDDDEERKIELGPQCTLKEQLEKDKVCWFLSCSVLSLVLSLLLRGRRKKNSMLLFV